MPINVVVNGEVIYPGTYSLISEGDRISDIIDRCGGLTENAPQEGTKRAVSLEVTRWDVGFHVLANVGRKTQQLAHIEPIESRLTRQVLGQKSSSSLT